LAKEIRKLNGKIPLIFLTAKTLKEDVLEGFRIGADDYLTKPFDSEVLLCKINAILKRNTPDPGDEDQPIFYQVGGIYFDYRLRTLKIGTTVQPLSPKESELLKLLCSAKDGILPRQVALRRIWGKEDYFTTRSMDVFIARLRKYLRADPSIEIINIHGNGFRLVVR
jgi:DNA-binding response OmpR family regulator